MVLDGDTQSTPPPHAGSISQSLVNNSKPRQTWIQALYEERDIRQSYQNKPTYVVCRL